MLPSAKVLGTITGWAAVVLGFLAAWLWYRSTAAVLYSREEAKRDHDLINYFATAESQSSWNKRAAAATAGSLLCQAISLALQQLDRL
jgi:hypothetical protein